MTKSGVAIYTIAVEFTDLSNTQVMDLMREKLQGINSVSMQDTALKLMYIARPPKDAMELVDSIRANDEMISDINLSDRMLFDTREIAHKFYFEGGSQIRVGRRLICDAIDNQRLVISMELNRDKELLSVMNGTLK